MNYLRRVTDRGRGEKASQKGVENVFSEAYKQENRLLGLVQQTFPSHPSANSQIRCDTQSDLRHFVLKDGCLDRWLHGHKGGRKKERATSTLSINLG